MKFSWSVSSYYSYNFKGANGFRPKENDGRRRQWDDGCHVIAVCKYDIPMSEYIIEKYDDDYYLLTIDHHKGGYYRASM